MKNNIRFNNPTNPNNISIADIEKFTGFKLPENIALFLFKNGGARIYLNEEDEAYFDLVYPDNWKIDDTLLFVESLESIKGKWQYRDYLQEFAEDFEVSKEYVETDKLFPLLETHSGSAIYVAIGGAHDGKIFHVDNGDFGFCFLADSLADFLNICYVYKEE